MKRRKKKAEMKNEFEKGTGKWGRNYGIEKRESGLTSIGSRRPVESGGYGLSDIVDTIIHFRWSFKCN
jgi:hypothetical protein